MKLNIDPEWLNKMADEEDKAGGIVSVGGFWHGVREREKQARAVLLLQIGLMATSVILLGLFVYMAAQGKETVATICWSVSVALVIAFNIFVLSWPGGEKRARQNRL